MSPEKSVRPVKDFLLVQTQEKEETTIGGIILPEAAEEKALKTGRVLALGPYISGADSSSDTELSEGELVLYDSRVSEPVGTQLGTQIIPLAAVIGVFESDQDPEPYCSPAPFFELPPWEEFATDDADDWENYLNLTLFEFKVDFLEPFHGLGPLAKRVHECVVNNIRKIDGIDLSSVRFKVDEKDSITLLNHDLWHCGFVVSEKRNAFVLQKQATSIPELNRTIPTLLTAFYDVLLSDEFASIGGNDFSRITDVVIRFHQRIRLKGRGARLSEINNSDLMEQFLLFGQEGQKALLDALGIKPRDTGRIDLKVSFEREIEGHDYLIFLSVEAPANEDHTVLDIEWEIQDLNPGNMAERTYSPVMVNFFRDVVLRSFYKRWFQVNDDVVCTADKR